MRPINWFALAGGILTLVLAVVSLNVPWWQITVGGLAKAGWSPVGLNVGVFGVPITVPLLNFVSLIFMLLLVAAGIALVLYSLVPAKPYAKHLLGFAYKKPLVIFILFIVGLLLISNAWTIASLAFHLNSASAQIPNLNPPLSGTKNVTISFSSSSNGGGSSVSLTVPLSTSLQWTFWLALVVAGLCVAARIYHRKFAKAALTAAGAVQAHPSAEETPVKPKPVPEKTAEAAARPTAAPQPKKRGFCPDCGEQLPVSKKFCPFCGFNLQTGQGRTANDE